GEVLQPLPGCVSLFLFYPRVRFAHPRLISFRPAGAQCVTGSMKSSTKAIVRAGGRTGTGRRKPGRKLSTFLVYRSGVGSGPIFLWPAPAGTGRVSAATDKALPG